MRKLLLTSTLLANGVACLAQTGTIRGTVKTSDNLPAEFVEVFLKGSSKTAYTDAKGNYLIKNVTPGAYTVIVPVVGLKAEERSVLVKAEDTATVDISLQENSQKLQEVVIRGDHNKYKVNAPSQSLRLTTPLIEVPQNIQVVTMAALKDQQIISMSDGVTRNVSGLVRLEHWGDLYTNITARGSQIQAFRNGFNVVNSYWGPLTEDMSYVESIEVVKGPAGFMLSSGDPSGLYNVVTKKPTGQTKGEATFTVGSFNLYRAALDLDGKLSKNGKLLYRLNMAAQNKGSHRPNEYNDRYTIAPVVTYDLDNQTKLTFEYNYQRANMSDVGSYYVFAPSGFGTLPVNATQLPGGLPGTKINDHSMYANIAHKFSDNWKITGQVARFIYDQQGSSMWPSEVRPDGSMIRSVGIWDAYSTMTMGQVFVNGEVKTGPVNHRILGGLDMANKNYMADWMTSHKLDDSTAPFSPNDPDLGRPQLGYPQFDRSIPLSERAQGGKIDQTYSSLYLQDELGFFDNKARLTLAGRYTDLSQASYGNAPSKAQHFTPRVGLSVSIDKSTAVYALHDQAFIPQTGMLSDGGKVQPITGDNSEIGIKRDWFDGKWNTSLSVYRIIKNNELTNDPFAAPTSNLMIELGQKQAQGLEFDLRGNITRGLSIIANYAYTDAKVTKVANGVTFMKVGDIVPGYAKHTANIWLTYKIESGVLKGFGISAGGTLLVDRATYWEVSPDPAQTLPDYLKVDGGLFWENNKLKVTANVFNVLNEYLYSGSYYGYIPAYYWQTEAPRNLRLSIGYKF